MSPRMCVVVVIMYSNIDIADIVIRVAVVVGGVVVIVVVDVVVWFI